MSRATEAAARTGAPRLHAPAPFAGAGTRYVYRARRVNGTFEVGELAAVSREAASAALTALGLFPLDIRPEARTPSDRRAKLRTRDLALGLRMLAQLLESNLPLKRALPVYSTLAPAAWTPAILSAIQESVLEGKSLAAALAAAPVAIPPLVIGMIEAGEAGSGLSQAVRRAAELMEKAAATRAAIQSALVYPCILAVAGTLSVGLLVGVVLPRFAAIVADLGETLPTSTRLVLAAAVAGRAAAVPFLVLLVAAFIAWRWWLASSEDARASWHGALLSLPIAGPTRRAAASSRVTASLAALLASGVTIAPALLHVARAAGDAAISRRLLAARVRVIGGERLSSALEQTDALTVSTVQLVRAGEATGGLAAMLEHAARLEGEWAEQRVRSVVRMVEPILILIFGAVVALIAASLLQAVYSVRPGA